MGVYDATVDVRRATGAPLLLPTVDGVPLQGILGILVFVGLAWGLSENRRAVSVRLALAGVAVQITVGFVLLELPVFTRAFAGLNQVVLVLEESTRAGTAVVFGYLAGGRCPTRSPRAGRATSSRSGACRSSWS